MDGDCGFASGLLHHAFGTAFVVRASSGSGRMALRTSGGGSNPLPAAALNARLVRQHYKTRLSNGLPRRKPLHERLRRSLFIISSRAATEIHGNRAPGKAPPSRNRPLGYPSSGCEQLANTIFRTPAKRKKCLDQRGCGAHEFLGAPRLS